MEEEIAEVEVKAEDHQGVEDNLHVSKKTGLTTGFFMPFALPQMAQHFFIKYTYLCPS
jgi:hypothetical protein